MKNRILNIIILCLLAFTLSTCSKGDSAVGGASDTGVGGSTARFAIQGDYLYTVNNYSLRLFNISNPANVLPVNNINLGFGIETIFPYKNNIFIGTQMGMYIFDVTNPASPQQLSYFQHVYSCDPVVAEDGFAYVTLNTINSRCGRLNNVLQIIDIKDLTKPTLVKQYPMTGPTGLGIDNKLLFLCDEGLKVYDVTDPYNIVLKYKFLISADDVIPLGDLLLVLGSNCLYQYRYTGGEVKLLSKIIITPDVLL